MTGFGSSCGACKFLRRRCTRECIFAPYFSYEQAATHFAAVHKVFGASNVSKLLLHLPLHGRSDAAITVAYEALARMHDPVYGCVAHIFALQQQVASLEEEIERIENLLVTTNNPYFVTQPDIITSNCSNQQTVPIVYSENASTNQACNINTVFENRTSDEEISQAYLDSIILESLLEEVNMHSTWIEIAEII